MPITKARFRISEYNERRKRDVKNKEKRIRAVSLSLTSMVDMFAILVIFLLTNQDSVTQWVDVGHGIELPKAKFSGAPPKSGTIQIARDGVFGDAKLASLDDVVKGPDVVDAVKTWLVALDGKNGGKKGYLNIVAHEKIPFGAVRKVVATAQAAGFTNVNLAVQPKSN